MKENEKWQINKQVNEKDKRKLKLMKENKS